MTCGKLRYISKSIASILWDMTISTQEKLTHVWMCNPAGLLLHVVWGPLAQEILTQQERALTEAVKLVIGLENSVKGNSGWV